MKPKITKKPAIIGIEHSHILCFLTQYIFYTVLFLYRNRFMRRSRDVVGLG